MKCTRPLLLILTAILAAGFAASCQKEQQEDNTPTKKTGQVLHLPYLEIVTPNFKPVTSKAVWVEGAEAILIDEYNDTTQLGKLNIHVRGNSSATWPKKPYGITLDDGKAILGMPADRHWILLANWLDRTNLRNDVAFEIARRTKSLQWTPKGRFIELYLNGTHLGNYYLTEKIRIDKNRVNISKTDGYILELDKYYDEPYKFKSNQLNLPVMVKEPDVDEMDAQKFTKIQSQFNAAELSLSNCYNNDDYIELIDIDSFIDWFFVNELTLNEESYHPKSCYMYHDKTGKYHAGPVWDYDWNTFSYNHSTKFISKNHIWYKYFFYSKTFRTRLKEKWAESYDDFADIPNYIRDKAKEIRNSCLRDCGMWPIEYDVNGDEQLSFDDAVNRMITRYEQRLTEVSAAIEAL